MEGFPINIPTLYLNSLILVSVAYPAGLSHSLFAHSIGAPRKVSTNLLAVLVLPYMAVVPAAWSVSPSLFAPFLLSPSMLKLHGSRWPLLIALAVFLVPIALAIEYGIHGIASYRRTGRIPRGIAVQSFWLKDLSPVDHFLLVLIAAGEEIFYRLIWLRVLVSFGLAPPLALVVSSVGYGLNHLYSGRTSVVSKSASGFLYGALYFVGGSIWLPILTHGLQNFALFQLTRERHV